MLLFAAASALLGVWTGSAQMRDPLPVPDVRGFKTLKCDLHIHTVISDGEVWPTLRVREAWRDGLDVIAFTDHSDYNPHKDDIKPDVARAFALAQPKAQELGIVVVPGVEVAEADIHFNALFVADPNALKGLKVIEALQKARAQDAFVFWNHPGWKQTPQWFPLVAEAFSQKLFQGMELVNGPNFYKEAYPWVAEKKLTILCDSDAHEPVAPAAPGMVRPITLVFASSKDVAGVREALFAGRTAAWMGGELWGAESHLKGLWEGAIRVETTGSNTRRGGPGFAMRLNNLSAMPLRLRLARKPDWLRGFSEPISMPGQSSYSANISAGKNAPAGRQEAELELEVTNFHISPEKNLTVRVSLTVDVSE